MARCASSQRFYHKEEICWLTTAANKVYELTNYLRLRFLGYLVAVRTVNSGTRFSEGKNEFTKVWRFIRNCINTLFWVMFAFIYLSYLFTGSLVLLRPAKIGM